jgi:hypothetical protein
MLVALLGRNPAELLHPYRVPITVPEAISYLEFHTQSLGILSLYQHYFPDAFEDDKAHGLLLPEKGEAYSEAEMNFFKLVEECLFPLHPYFLDFQEERTTEIFVELHSLDWWNSSWSDWRFGWQFLFKLSDCGLDGDLDERSEALLINVLGGMHEITTTRAVLDALEVSQSSVDIEELIAVCEREVEPLCWLPIAYLVIGHSTGCGFLDYTEEEGSNLRWDCETVDYLTEQWKMARDILSKVSYLLDEIEGSHEAQMRVIELWRQASAERVQVAV